MTDRLLEQLLDELADRVAARLAPVTAPSGSSALPEEWRLLDVKEAAARLGRSVRWVRERKAAIGYVKLDDGALAFDLDDLRAFARARRVPLDRLQSADDTAPIPLRARAG